MHILTEENGSGSDLTPVEKGKALLHHMIHHSEQHLEEFVSLRETMTKEGESIASEELAKVIESAEEQLVHLRAAYEALG